jgi:hypothetical protein
MLLLERAENNSQLEEDKHSSNKKIVIRKEKINQPFSLEITQRRKHEIRSRSSEPSHCSTERCTRSIDKDWISVGHPWKKDRCWKTSGKPASPNLIAGCRIPDDQRLVKLERKCSSERKPGGCTKNRVHP